MNLEELMLDIHALQDEMRMYERKYKVLTETFYASYARGEEPPDGCPLKDWVAWASAYDLCRERHAQHERMIAALRQQTPSAPHT